MAESKKTRPAAEVTYWPVRATIWKNVVKTKDGTERTRYSTQLSRQYKDERGNYQTTSSLDTEDLLLAAEAVRAAFHEIQRLQSQDRREASGPETSPSEECYSSFVA